MSDNKTNTTNKKRTIKRTISTLLVLAIGFTALGLIQHLLVPKYQRGIVEGSMIEEYYSSIGPHEVLFVGDCEVYENISTVELWREYGITSYIRGSAQQLTWNSYYLIEDAFNHAEQLPEVVVFNVLALKYNEPQSETYNRMSIDGMPFSITKLNNIYASMTEEESVIEYLFPILRYHDRWSSLVPSDFDYYLEKDLVTVNGYYMRADIKPQGRFPSAPPLADYTLGENAMQYLEMMAELCEENGVELLLIKAPTEWPHWYPEWDEQVELFAREHNINYLNLIPLQDEIGLDMSEDTYDAGLHLNVYGAEKLARYLGQYLVSNYNLTDWRNNATIAEAWTSLEELYDSILARQLYELETYGELVSFGANAIEE